MCCLKGQSILWSWKNSGDELHNIVRVGYPDSDVRRIVINLASVDNVCLSMNTGQNMVIVRVAVSKFGCKLT